MALSLPQIRSFSPENQREVACRGSIIDHFLFGGQKTHRFYRCIRGIPPWQGPYMSEEIVHVFGLIIYFVCKYKG